MIGNTVSSAFFMMDLSPPDSLESLHVVETKIKSLEESTQALRRHRNTLLPISRLPTEIFTAIFSLLHPFGVREPPQPIAPLSISHVCHRWREISLNLPHLWSHINFTRQTPDCSAEMLARAKMAPLHLEAVTSNWSREKFEAFKRQIEAHIHHTHHLGVTTTSHYLVRTFGRLVSSAPFLEQFSITNEDYSWHTPPVIPDNLFDGIAPKLVYLRLDNCGVRRAWKSPLFKGLRDLKLFSYPRRARTSLNIWLDALNQMTQLERLTLHDGIPIRSVTPLPVEPALTVVLSSLTELDISASLRDCTVLLAHLVLPALTRLSVNVHFTSTLLAADHMPLLIQCVTRNAHGPQDTEVLQSLFVGSDKPQAGFAAWNMPRQDTDAWMCNPDDLPDGIHLPRVAFSISREWLYESDILVYNELLTALPLNSITSLTVKGRAPLTWDIWRGHVPRWHKLQRVRLFSSAVPAFREIFVDDPSGDPLFPSLEELVLIDVSLDTHRVIFLYLILADLLVHRIFIKTLDLRTCIATSGAVRLLSQVVLNVQGPAKRKSADLGGKTRGGMELLGEEEERDEEQEFPKSVRPYWDTDDDYDFAVEDEDDDDETSSTGSEFDVLVAPVSPVSTENDL